MMHMNKLQIFGLWKEHCHGEFPSLFEEPQGALSSTDAESIARYLENCPIWVASPGLENSKVFPAEVAGTLSIRTDGQWAWQDTMAHYVRKLRISPPSAFVNDVEKKNGVWPSEHDVNIALMVFPDF
jgi:hypothetical protein